jgi:hypothetical protein
MLFPPAVRVDQSEQTRNSNPDAHPASNNAGRIHIGEVLRHHIEEVIARYVARMRNDPLIPLAKSLPTAMLEDHAMSFLGDLFQSLIVVEKSEVLNDREESNLLDDGSRIQFLIAELHGAQRHRVGWTEAALHREYDILKEEVGRQVKARAEDPEGAIDPDAALALLSRLLDRARNASVTAFGAAGKS